ncbi:hypothetical protein Q4F19_00160 [Sphingomonas sp. BIUV-7]|uniref:UrcA family protein n=1 Tax=Sphingomonas natans TaxID=3063330 RepID=A0ABT8Y504_9SPHN|nr:hypothetical protein [Sphingomonas sp. BIUV-7]MDO6412784.1 hypothetical protein [Sphingomonas sp. BIUV-7]
MRGMAAATFPVAVFFLIPPTETKASWSSIHHDVTPFSAAPAAETSAPDYAYPVSYGPPASPQFVRSEDRDGAIDEATAHEIAIADEDRAYGDGYAWASEHEVADARECRRLRRARASGCRDYVASLMPAPEPERQATDRIDPSL